MSDLKELQTKTEKFVIERDWLKYQRPKSLSMSIAIEAAELMEHFQWAENKAAEEITDEKKRQEIKEELADICIYCMGMANRFGFDLSQAIVEKIEKNAKKYPLDNDNSKPL